MLSDSSFRIQPLPRIVFGVDSVAQLAKHVAGCGTDRALIVTDKGLVGAGLVAPLSQLLESEGIEVAVFDGVEGNQACPAIGAFLLTEPGSVPESPAPARSYLQRPSGRCRELQQP